MVGSSGVITYANLGEDRLRRLGVAGVKLCPSTLTLIVALTTLSHCRATVRSTSKLSVITINIAPVAVLCFVCTRLIKTQKLTVQCMDEYR